jgi:hypothetical protein
VTLYVSPCGLTTSTIPYGTGAFNLEFDFLRHQLLVRSSNGDQRSVALAPKPVADFYAETMHALAELGVQAKIQARPNEVAPAIPFAEDYQHASYDAEAAQLFWRQLVQAHRVIGQVPVVLRRQGQPGALLLGRHGPGLHPVLRAISAAASGRYPELPRLSDARGLLARAQQLRILGRAAVRKALFTPTRTPSPTFC